MADLSLRILQVSPADIQGGAERVAWSLFQAYRQRGHCSWLAVGKKRSQDPDVLAIPNQEMYGKLHRLFSRLALDGQRLEGGRRVDTPWSRLSGIAAEPRKRLAALLGHEDFHFPGTSRLLELPGQAPNILHAHNLHGYYFDLRELPRLSQRVPLLLTLHDAWLLSGHCAHSFDCERWKTGCGQCPDLTLYPEIQRDATAYNWQRKRQIYARSRLYVATPSRWLMQKVEASMLAPAVVDARVVPNGVDLSIFHPADRQVARAELGLPAGAKVLLASGVKLWENRWKDYPTLHEAIGRLTRREQGQFLLLIVLGGEAPAQQAGNAEVRFVPYQPEVEAVVRYYQASDVYVHAARADTFPTTLLEALACGLPVVATGVGGIPEQVQEATTGFLVRPGDAAGMAERLDQLLSDDDLRGWMGQQAAQSARKKFSLERQVDAYLAWYRELVSREKSPIRRRSEEAPGERDG